MINMSKIIVIVGPTGVGKTASSIYLAHKYNAEIINADSAGVYKEPLIATAKVTEEEKDGVIHHMLDLVSLDDDFTLYDYQVKGRKILDDLISKNKNIIIVGGSGLYIKALLYDYKLDKTDNVKVDYSKYTNQELKNMADKIDKNNNIEEGSQIVQEDYKGLDGQKWIIRDSKVNGWVIESLSNPELALSIEGTIGNGSKIILSKSETTDNQMYYLYNLNNEQKKLWIQKNIYRNGHKSIRTTW